MESMRESWTDERLDDLNQRVDRGFERVDADLRELRLEMKGGFDRVDERFDALHRLMIQFCGAMLVALIGLIASLTGLFVTQL
jgi:hypothetical protein